MDHDEGRTSDDHDGLRADTFDAVVRASAIAAAVVALGGYLDDSLRLEFDLAQIDVLGPAIVPYDPGPQERSSIADGLWAQAANDAANLLDARGDHLAAEVALRQMLRVWRFVAPGSHAALAGRIALVAARAGHPDRATTALALVERIGDGPDPDEALNARRVLDARHPGHVAGSAAGTSIDELVMALQV